MAKYVKIRFYVEKCRRDKIYAIDIPNKKAAPNK